MGCAQSKSACKSSSNCEQNLWNTVETRQREQDNVHTLDHKKSPVCGYLSVDNLITIGLRDPVHDNLVTDNLNNETASVSTHGSELTPSLCAELGFNNYQKKPAQQERRLRERIRVNCARRTGAKGTRVRVLAAARLAPEPQDRVIVKRAGLSNSSGGLDSPIKDTYGLEIFVVGSVATLDRIRDAVEREVFSWNEGARVVPRQAIVGDVVPASRTTAPKLPALLIFPNRGACDHSEQTPLEVTTATIQAGHVLDYTNAFQVPASQAEYEELLRGADAGPLSAALVALAAAEEQQSRLEAAAADGHARVTALRLASKAATGQAAAAVHLKAVSAGV